MVSDSWMTVAASHGLLQLTQLQVTGFYFLLRPSHILLHAAFFLFTFFFDTAWISDLLCAASTRCAGFFLPSICARLCLRAAIRSTTGAGLPGFSTAVTSLPSRCALISSFTFSSNVSRYLLASNFASSALMSWWAKIGRAHV